MVTGRERNVEIRENTMNVEACLLTSGGCAKDSKDRYFMDWRASEYRVDGVKVVCRARRWACEIVVHAD